MWQAAVDVVDVFCDSAIDVFSDTNAVAIVAVFYGLFVVFVLG